LDQISSDHPVRKLISKFRKISQENRAAAQTNSNTSAPSTTTNTSQQQPSSLPSIPETTIQPASAEPIDSSPTTNPPSSTSSLQLLQLPFPPTNKPRDKLETISERIESQESQTSQITSVNQSPPLHRPLKSSKWKWLKTGSTEPDNSSSSKPLVSTLKPPSVPQQQSTNPFDPNLSDDDTQSKLSDGNERRLSIPLSLFIPRSARRGSLKTSEDENNDQVNHFVNVETLFQLNSLFLFFLFVIRNNWKNLILI
jgi:hypothetical protein